MVAPPVLTKLCGERFLFRGEPEGPGDSSKSSEGDRGGSGTRTWPIGEQGMEETKIG